MLGNTELSFLALSSSVRKFALVVQDNSASLIKRVVTFFAAFWSALLLWQSVLMLSRRPQ